jgi:hypothetical protein
MSVPVSYRSVTAATGVPLLIVRDVVSGLIEIRGVFTERTPALVWVENGRGGSIGIALIQEGGDLRLAVDDEFEIPLEGGITPETLVRFAVSEFGEPEGSLISLTLFSCLDAPLSPRLINGDARFPGRAAALRQRSWPLIFRPAHYVDKYDEPCDTCHAWAMGLGAPVEVASPVALYGCNLFLRRCQTPQVWRP